MHYFKIFAPQATYTEVIDQMPILTFLGLTKGMACPGYVALVKVSFTCLACGSTFFEDEENCSEFVILAVLCWCTALSNDFRFAATCVVAFVHIPKY